MRKKERSASVRAYAKPAMRVVEMRMTGAVLTASGDTNADDYEKTSDTELGWDDAES